MHGWHTKHNRKSTWSVIKSSLFYNGVWVYKIKYCVSSTLWNNYHTSLICEVKKRRRVKGHIVKLSTTLNHCSLTKKPDSLSDWWSTKLQPLELKSKLLWNLSLGFPGSTRRFLENKAVNSNNVMGCLPLPKIRPRHKCNMCSFNQTEIRSCY